jgi:hypothetical protein
MLNTTKIRIEQTYGIEKVYHNSYTCLEESNEQRMRDRQRRKKESRYLETKIKDRRKQIESI